MFLQDTPPDTSGYMIAGYAIAFIVMALYVASIYIRNNNLKQDEAMLDEMDKAAAPVETKAPSSSKSKKTVTKKTRKK